ncbi:hypothetical protein L7F22_045269 [Adiantum nelumboides]|nr:hypothetical protein [Adiantum nelumboides]
MRDGVTAAGSKRTTIKRLWKSFFADRSQWWDYRLFKRNPKAPDFQHKATKDKLWLDGTRNPNWVRFILAKQDKACPTPPSFALPTPMLEKKKEEKLTTLSRVVPAITMEELTLKQNKKSSSVPIIETRLRRSKKEKKSFIIGKVCDWHALSVEDFVHALEKGLYSEPSNETLVYIICKGAKIKIENSPCGCLLICSEMGLILTKILETMLSLCWWRLKACVMLGLFLIGWF